MTFFSKLISKNLNISSGSFFFFFLFQSYAKIKKIALFLICLAILFGKSANLHNHFLFLLLFGFVYDSISIHFYILLALNSTSHTSQLLRRSLLFQSTPDILNISSTFCTSESATQAGGPADATRDEPKASEPTAGSSSSSPDATTRTSTSAAKKPSPVTYVNPNPKYKDLPKLPNDASVQREGSGSELGYGDEVFTTLRLPETVARNIPDQVLKVLDISMASQMEKNRARIQYAIRRFRRHPHDVGSSEVQS